MFTLLCLVLWYLTIHSLHFLIPCEVFMFSNLYKFFEVKDGNCPHTLHSRRYRAPSKCSTNTWGTEFIALGFIPKSSISLSLLFNFSWKLARSSWLLLESFASLCHIFQAYFSTDLMFWCAPCIFLICLYFLLFHKAKCEMIHAFIGTVQPWVFSPLTKPFMWRKLLIQDSDIQSHFT